MSRPLLTLVLLLGAARPVAAQPSDALVPTELARALVSFENGFARAMGAPGADSLPVIAVGRAPVGFPRALVPAAPVTLLGGARTSLGASLVAVVPASIGDAVSTFRSAAEGAGWHAVRLPGMPEGDGGFVQSAATPDENPRFFCRGDTSVVAMATSRPGGGRYLLLSTSVGAAASICRLPARSSPYPEVPLPTLRAPDGVQVRPGGWSGGGDQLTTEQRLRTTLDAAALLAHFAPQLAAQGWTLVDRAASRSAALQSARRRLPNGETWRALLVAQRASDDGDVDVVLRLARGEVP